MMMANKISAAPRVPSSLAAARPATPISPLDLLAKRLLFEFVRDAPGFGGHDSESKPGKYVRVIRLCDGDPLAAEIDRFERAAGADQRIDISYWPRFAPFHRGGNAAKTVCLPSPSILELK